LIIKVANVVKTFGTDCVYSILISGKSLECKNIFAGHNVYYYLHVLTKLMLVFYSYV